MANPHRGQVSLRAGDADYTLSLSVNAMCEIEDRTQKGILDIVSEFQKKSIRFTTLRLLFWAALQDHHPEIDIRQAGDIISIAGNSQAFEAIGRAFQLAFPAVEETETRPL